MAAFLTSATLLTLSAGALLFKVETSQVAWLFVLAALWPMMISTAGCLLAQEKRPLQLLLSSSILYGLWFGFLYVSLFYLHPDPQGGIVFLFAGLYASPLLVILWITALVLEIIGWKTGRSAAPHRN